MFDLNKCASAVAVAMVGTIRTGDDASRFAQRAIAEGFDSISDLIAADAVKQAVALKKALGVVTVDVSVNIPTPVQEIKIGVSTESIQPAIDAMNPLKEVAEAIWPQKDADEVFAPLAPVPPVPEPEDTISTNTTMVAVGSVDVDSRGLPWDGRIHSSSKGKIVKDGTWKLRRNIDQAVVEQVEAELLAVMTIPKPALIATDTDSSTSTEATSIAPPAPEPVIETQGLHPDSNAFSPSTVNKLVEQGNAVPPVAASTPQNGALSKPYSEFNMADLMRGITSKKIDPEHAKTIAAQFGIPSIPVLATRPDIIPLVAEALEL